MKVSILSHCSHNKGDNSVLAFLGTSIKSSKVHISTSSGELPFWFNNNAISTLWGCGKRFPTKNERFFNKILRVARNRFIDKLYYLVLILFSANKNKLALFLLSSITNNKFKSEINESEYVICTGGHHISSVLDQNGVNTQLMDMIYTILINKPLYLWAQSIGPVETDKKYIISAIAKLLNRAELICYRDSDSKKFLDDNHIKSKNMLVDDSVFGLRKKLFSEVNNTIEKSPLKSNDKTKRAVIAVYTAGKLKNNKLEDYFNIILKTVNYLINKGYLIELLPMQYEGLQDDERPFLNKIKSHAEDTTKVIVLNDDMSPFETLKYLKGIDLLIGHKTHSVVYGLALAIPTLAISYHPKTTFFMSRFGMDNFFIDDKELSFDLLKNKLQLIENSKDDISSKLSVKSDEIGESVLKSFGYVGL